MLEINIFLAWVQIHIVYKNECHTPNISQLLCYNKNKQD